CRHIEICEKYGFKDIVISLKSSDVNLMIEANRIFSKRYDYPLHLGVTESGTFRSGSIRSSIGIGSLLSEGIGDTIRVSLTEDVVREVEVGREILKSLGFVNSGVTIVSCPTCGRLEVDLIGIVNRVEQKVGLMKKAVKVAIMGCAVNGPGEAKDADIGVACGRGGALLFKDGEVIQKIDEGEIVDRLVHEIERY
ncbi:MAG: flavodoxin-dependent (E)-4-hydroxy-3-methylbut-2-enyl-diphosphate synthase, partial [Fidelibacterota bacterium]